MTPPCSTNPRPSLPTNGVALAILATATATTEAADSSNRWLKPNGNRLEDPFGLFVSCRSALANGLESTQKSPPDCSGGLQYVYSVVGSFTGSCASTKLLSAIRHHHRSRISSHRRIRHHHRRIGHHRILGALGGRFGFRAARRCKGNHGCEKEGGFRECFHSFDLFLFSGEK